MAAPPSLDQIDVAALVADHQAGLWRYLRFLGCERSLAEDLTQETFVKVLEKPFEVRGRAQTASYLRTVARNLFLGSKRKTSRVQCVEDIDSADRVWESWAADEDGGEERLSALKVCLDEVEGRGSEALARRYQSRESSAAIGAALGISEANVRVLLHRVRTALRKCIQRRIGS